MMNKHTYTPFRKPAIAASLAMLLLILMSCSLPGLLAAATPTPQPSPTPLPSDTHTQMPPTAIPTSTSTPMPTATATKVPVSIVFSAGTTAGVVQGTIEPSQVQAYTVSAGQNQPMILLLNSSDNSAYLGVTEPNGTILLDPAKKWTNWQWLLPKTETYTIRVYGGSTTASYTLTTKVAQRITFASGATSATLNGSTPKGFVFSYAIACKASQVMTLSLNVPASIAYLDVFGLATGKLLSSSAKVNTWTGSLPATEDYIIEVIPVNGQVINYSLSVTVQ